MNFFQTFKDSVYSPLFYREVKNRETSFSVKYFAKLVLLISCIVALVPIVGILGLLTWKQDTVTQIRAQIVETYPKELVLQFKNGEVSTNVQEPYAIHFPEMLKEKVSRMRVPYVPTNLLVINTGKQIERGDFEQYQTLAILGKNEFGVFDPERGRVEIQNLNTFASNRTFTLNQEGFRSLNEKGWKVLSAVGILMIFLLPLLIFIGIFIGSLIYLLFGALFIWLASSIAKKNMTYGQSYKAGLHLITLPLVGMFLLPFLFDAPFVFTLVLFIMAYINFNQAAEASENDGSEQKQEV